jgi:DNA replication protein DnaC
VTIPDRLAQVLARVRPMDGAELVDPQREVREQRRRMVLERVGFGLPAETAELLVRDDLYSTRALEAAKAWVAGPRTVLVVIGDMGTGKSTACTWAALERLSVGPIEYVLESDLAHWRWARRAHEAQWRALMNAGTVIVDEVGRTPPEQREMARIANAELVHHRTGFRGRRRTIFQGNVTLEEFAELADDRLMDRLEEIGSIVECVGPSLRGKR